MFRVWLYVKMENVEEKLQRFFFNRKCIDISFSMFSIFVWSGIKLSR